MMRLKHAADRARELMDRHGLDEWTLRFNGARKNWANAVRSRSGRYPTHGSARTPAPTLNRR